jgi:hypothetical protein
VLLRLREPTSQETAEIMALGLRMCPRPPVETRLGPDGRMDPDDIDRAAPSAPVSEILVLRGPFEEYVLRFGATWCLWTPRRPAPWRPPRG